MAAYYNALQYVITGNESHALISIKILDGWGATLKIITGHDAQLVASLYGFQILNAAEIIRFI